MKKSGLSTNTFRVPGHRCRTGVVLLLLSLAFPTVSLGATILVDTLADDALVNGNCTFREAIEAANTDLGVDNCDAGSGTDEIRLEVVGTIQLTADLPAVTDSVSIIGPGPDELEISGNIGLLNPTYRLLQLQSDAFSSKTYTVRGLSLVGGSSPTVGGGIDIEGDSIATVEFVRISNCRANTSGGGIAIKAGPAGGAVSEVTIRWSTIESNQVITSLSGGGGGLSIEGVTEVHLENSTLFLNETLGSSAPGGGIWIAGGGSLDATVFIRRSTLRGNNTAAEKGGGIYARTIDNLPTFTQAVTLTVEDSTITGNSVSGGGTSSVDNEGGGLFLVGSGVTATMGNTIVADNTVLGGVAVNEDVATVAAMGTVVVVSNGFNFIGEQNTLVGFPPGNPNANNDYVFTGGDPGLLPFGDYGGPTRTQPPADTTSLVVDQGGCSQAPAEPFDQRGYGFLTPPSRIVDIGFVPNASDGCDIGAVELIGGGQDVGPVADYDGDGVPDDNDNCVASANPAQTNLDGDALGNACDPDVDNDGVFNAADTDDDNDGLSDGDEAIAGTDPLDPDSDDDNVEDGLDNAPSLSNNACGGDRETFDEVVTRTIVCGATTSILVESPASVETGGNLRLVSPVVTFQSLSVSGELDVFNAEPCAACP